MGASSQPASMGQLRQAPDLLPNRTLVSQRSAVESEYGAAFVACARIQLLRSFDPPFVGSTERNSSLFFDFVSHGAQVRNVRASFSCRVTNCQVIAGRSRLEYRNLNYPQPIGKLSNGPDVTAISKYIRTHSLCLVTFRWSFNRSPSDAARK